MPSVPLPQRPGRVLLRRLTRADLVRFQAYRHDAEVGFYQGWEPVPDREAIQFLDDMSHMQLFPVGAWVQLGIADQRTNNLVGDVGVCVSADGKEAEIGFTLSRAAQSSGLGTDAVRQLTDLIFNSTEVVRIVAIADDRNTRAHRLLLRTSFRKTETISELFRGEPCIEQVWELSRAARATGGRGGMNA